MAHTHRTAGRRLRVAAAGFAVAATAALAPAGVALAGSQSPPGAAHAAAQARTAEVMTRNLYLGADLQPMLDALAATPPNPLLILQTATATWGRVQASQPAARMAAIADEIVAERPAAVGLQEVTLWTTYAHYDQATGQASDPSTAYDFLELLLKSLADRGVTYEAVDGATSTNFTSPPIPILTATGLGAVQQVDRDVIIRRADVKAWNAHHGNYQHILSFSYLGQQLPVARGWGSVDLRTKLATFRFVNSHLEAFGGAQAEPLRMAQVGELLAAQAAIAQASGALPTVYVGDYNSKAPTAGAYQMLVGSGLTDAWTATRDGAPGFTCCQDPLLTNTVSELDQRIDLVLGTTGVRPVTADVIGDVPVDLPGGVRWPSDHAGVVADLVIG